MAMHYILPNSEWKANLFSSAILILVSLRYFIPLY